MKVPRLFEQLTAAVTLPLFLAGSVNFGAVAYGQNPNPNTTTPIKHVVVIFNENISFDHYFATYPFAANATGNEPVFNAAPNTPSVNGLTGPLMTNNPNSAPPFRLKRSEAITCDQDHGYADEQKAFNNGLMNLFVESVGVGSGACDPNGYGKKVVMGYFDGNTVTAIWNYAQNFAMSDNSYGTQFGPSTVGALNLVSGQTNGATLVSGSASGNVQSGTDIGDPRPALALDDCTIKTAAQITMSGKNVGDLLNAKGITWGWFQGGFKPTSVAADGTATCAATHNQFDGKTSGGNDYIPHHEPFQYYSSTANPHHLPPTSVAAIGTTDQANHQYDTSDFFAALAAGNMPAVSYIKAPGYEDGHAGYSNPLDEQTFLVNTVNAIANSPFWSTTAIILAYDDSDGWYDHQMPPIVTQSQTADDNLTGPGTCGTAPPANGIQGHCGYGPRLPLLVISPYAKVNFVDHTVTDQSSILRFIEDNWGLGRTGPNSTDNFAGPLTNLFNFQTGATQAKALVLDPSTGTAVTGGSTSNAGGGNGSGSGSTAVTAAVATPKNLTTTSKQFSLDGTMSTAFDGKPLTYAWTNAPGSPYAAISAANTATPSVQFADGPGLYSFQLTVTDSTGATKTDTATVQYIGR